MKNLKIISSLIIFFVLISFLSGPKIVEASTTPSFSISSVEVDENVTIYTKNFPANKNFKVLMGEYGTLGINGIEVTSINSGTGGSFYGTFLIPEGLKGRALIAIRLQGTDTPYYSYNWFYNKVGGSTGGSLPGYSGFPTFTIKAVEMDENVTIQTNNFPANTEFKVLMGKMWTQGIGGVEVTLLDSGSGGIFDKSFDIPDSLKGEQRIAIRLESINGYYAYNWFWNNTVTSSPSGYAGYPYFFIKSVEEDNSVTISGYNFPANTEFEVLMGKMWTQGIDGIQIESFNSGEGGNFEGTYEIPEELKGQERISIRLESIDGFYAYNWFWNNTSSVIPSTPGYSGIPTFTIKAVIRNNSVTISAKNFPANLDFTVLMGKMWTQGIGGFEVTTFDSGDGGDFEATYAIPEELSGLDRISIRLQSNSGYYAYNWFWNNTYP